MTDSNSARRLDFLDGLRGLAIALVMMLHYWEITWFDFSVKVLGFNFDVNFLATTGSLGVTLFFFISGFCLFLSFDRGRNVRHYANRRLFKILPSYLLSMLLIFIFFDFPYPTVISFAKHFFSHLFFIHNWFEETYGSINGVYWTLAVEVQFYVLFPFVFGFIRKRPVTALFASIILSQGFRLLIYKTNPANYNFWINQLPTYLEVFTAGIVGGIAFKGWQDQKPFPLSNRWTSTAFAAMGFVLMLLCFYWVHAYRFSPGIPQMMTWVRTPLTLTFLMIAWGTAFSHPAWHWLIANPIAVFLSHISYNLYLWHQYIGHRMLMAKIPSYEGDQHYDFVWQKKFLLLAAGVSILATWLITKFFETPILRKTDPRTKAATSDTKLETPVSIL